MPFLPPNQQRQSTEGTALKAQVNLIMRAKKKLLTSRQIFWYAVPARTVTKKHCMYYNDIK